MCKKKKIEIKKDQFAGVKRRQAEDVKIKRLKDNPRV